MDAYTGDDPTEQERSVYTNDAQGYLTKVEQSDNYGNTAVRTYALDDAGNILSDRQERADELHRLDEWTYDASGNAITHAEDRDGDGRWDTQWVREYDGDARVRREERLGSDGELLFTLEYVYTGRGDELASQTTTYEDGRVIEQKWLYNTGGLLDSITRSDDGETQLVETREYDDSGNLLRVVDYGRDGTARSETVYDYACWQ